MILAGWIVLGVVLYLLAGIGMGWAMILFSGGRDMSETEMGFHVAFWPLIIVFIMAVGGFPMVEAAFKAVLGLLGKLVKASRKVDF